MFPLYFLGLANGAKIALQFALLRSRSKSLAAKPEHTRNEVAPELMTCRIDRVVTDEQGVILRISGRITGQHVDTVRAALEQEDEKVAVDLKEVLLVDGEAVKLLALCEIRGIELRNTPAYIREWIVREKAQMHTEGAE